MNVDPAVTGKRGPAYWLGLGLGVRRATLRDASAFLSLSLV